MFAITSLNVFFLFWGDVLMDVLEDETNSSFLSL